MIDKDTIVFMAREAGMPSLSLIDIGYLKKFAALVAAAEREACAKACDVEAERLGWPTERFAADNCAAAIRARGQA